jgi:hypothetical protein
MPGSLAQRRFRCRDYRRAAMFWKIFSIVNRLEISIAILAGIT